MKKTIYCICLSVLLPTLSQAQESHECVMGPALIVKLASPVGGLLPEVLVLRGDVVSRGDVVASLRSEVEQTSVDLLAERASSDNEIMAQQAHLDLGMGRVERLKKLVEREIAPEERLEEAEVNLEVAVREMALAKMRQREAQLEHERVLKILKQRTIKSPIDGVVLERHLYTGEI